MSIPAAQYLRMSTEHQKYSLQNQEDAIRDYATAKGFQVVATYEDAARSGLRFKNRVGLQTLLKDVLTAPGRFHAVLVYDVSRWGRFQDTDEAAHYEFLCRRAAVPVHYVAEPFANNGEMADSILKALRRSMAAEYSRELGVRSFAGQKRLAGMGYRVGGQAGLGYRRVLLSEGQAPRILKSGEYKALTTDRVKLVLGPQDEVAFVRSLFKMALKKRIMDVTRFANEPQNLRFHDNGKLWAPEKLYRMLSNPKYCGSLVWHRTTQSIGRGHRHVNRSDWVVVPKAFPAIIDQQTFDEVQVEHRKRKRMPDDELLRRLKKLYLRKGRLSITLIESDASVLSKSVFIQRYGSILKAYELVGYKPSKRAITASLNMGRARRYRESLIRTIEEMHPAEIKPIKLPYTQWEGVMVNGTVVRLLFAHKYATRHGMERWELLPFRCQRTHITLLCLLGNDGHKVQEFILMPEIKFVSEYQIKGLDDPWLKNGVKLDSLTNFCDEVKKMALKKVEGEWSLEFPPTYTLRRPRHPSLKGEG